MDVPLTPRSQTYDPAEDPRLQIMSIITVPLYLFDADAIKIVWANAHAIDYWEADSLTELCHRDMESNITATARLRLFQIKQECFGTDHSIVERWTVYPKSKPKSADFRISAYRALNGRELLLMHIQNVHSATDSETAFRTTALMHTSTMISAFDKDLKLVYCNSAARESIPEEVTCAQQRLVNVRDLQLLTDQLREDDRCDAQIQIHTRQGIRWHSVHVQRCINPTNGRTMYLNSETDITTEHNAKQEAYRLAFTDSLTGLPNRAALNDHLEAMLGKGTAVRFAIYFLDLDRFKIINDSLGHAVGDQLLIDVAQRLRQTLGSEGFLCRLGGDEFVMLSTVSDQPDNLTSLARHILSVMAKPVMVSGHKLRVHPSIGISVYPDDGQSITSILENADAAMYMAKTKQCGFCLYDAKTSSSINQNVKDRMTLENDMVEAIENNQFELYYQPRISCDNLSVAGVEALIRWNHPQRGLVQPDEFISLAEETGQIVDLGKWVLLAAMRQQRLWLDQGLTVSVSINVSARQFYSNDLLANIFHALRQTGCDPAMIELEITESTLIGQTDSVNSTLQQLSAMGMRLALDDFGTGYSNLAYLQNFPLNCLKIDKIFLADRKRSMLMRTILNMGKILGLEVVAEGVETASQVDWLTTNDCDQMQGYYFSRPQPVSVITPYLIQNSVECCDTNNKAA
ncbi:MAG: putative bifunctional diguanylate cyclase/phosphodiesterase [Granulosicoccus sp.]